MQLEFTTFSDETTLSDIALTLEESMYKIPESIQPQIESVWNALKNNQPNLHPSPLFRVTTIDVARITVQTDITYKELVGIRNTDTFSDYFESIPYVLSLILFVYTRDRKLILVERNTGDWPTSLELPGAFMRPAYGIDLLKQAHTLLKSDLGIENAQIENHSVLGIYKNAKICEQMIIAEVNLALSYEELSSIAPRNIFTLPNEYRTDTHAQHFSLPLHAPTQQILEVTEKY